ncbi:MAG: ABC-2 family transporter protein [Thermomicrobiales bacterium]|nr:ABC-2 family transporter protein [Thermomicrobiales bacterium]
MIYLRLMRRYWQLAIARETQYRANFFAQGLVGIIETIITVLPMLLLFSFTDALDGWTRGETIALVGLFRTALALHGLLVDGGLSQFSGDVNEGKLDLLLIRPVNVQFLVTFRYVSLFQLVNVTIGLIVFGIGISQASIAPGWQAILQTIIIFICGLTLLTAVVSAGVYIAFRATTVEQINWAVLDVALMGQYPISFYPSAVRFALTAIVPVAFVTTVPMDALRGFTGWDTVLLTVAFTALVVQLVRWWWNNSVRHYASASS